MQPLVYLAGPISGLTYAGASDWREYAKKELAKSGIKARSPMRGKAFLESQGILQANCDAYGVMSAISSNKGITTRDRYDATTCDVLLVNVVGAKEVSKGTMIELGWADAHRVPIVLAMEPGNVHEHGIVKEVAGFIVPTLDEAIHIVRSILE